jgi:GAF domain-containing protein
LTEALEQQTATAEILRVISGSPTDVQPVFATILRSAVQLSGARRGSLLLFDGELMHVAALHGHSPGSATALDRAYPMRPSQNQVAVRAILRRAVVEIPDVRNDPDYLPGMADEMDLGSLLGVPMLRADGSPTGVVVIQRSEAGAFAASHVDLLKTFADQAVIAIENVRLFQELQDRVRELQALGDVGQAVSSTLDLQQVLTTIVANATRLAGADGGVVYEYDDSEGVFEVRAADRMTDQMDAVLRAARIGLGEGVVGRAGAARAPYQIADVASTDVLDPAIRERMLAEGLHSVLAVPLLREDRVLGGLVMTRRVPGKSPVEVVSLLQTFATQSALAIDNARLYRALEDASKHKSQFLANMSHELRTPLNAIIGYSEMLQEEAEDLDQETLIPDLQKVNAAGKHLLGLINDILDLSKIEAGRMDLFLESFSVNQLVQDVAAIVQPLVEKNGNTLIITCPDDLGTLHADQTKLRQTLFNLLSNAAKFTDHGSIELRIARDEAPPPAPPHCDGEGSTPRLAGAMVQSSSSAP